MSKLDEEQEKKRKRSFRKTLAAIKPLLLNPEGLRRLREISDEEWNDAAKRDETEPESP